MPGDDYPVVSVSGPLEAHEGRGTRPKFWIRIGEGTERWLLKIPRPDTGEHWAEKVAAEIGRLIGVDCAQIELARCVEQMVFGRPVHEGQEQGQAPRSEQNLLARSIR